MDADVFYFPTKFPFRDDHRGHIYDLVDINYSILYTPLHHNYGREGHLYVPIHSRLI
jgi:hypothetical protein